MTNIKLYYEKRGAHVHCRVFFNGKAGDLVFCEREWEAVRLRLELSVEVIPEGEFFAPLIRVSNRFKLPEGYQP